MKEISIEELKRLQLDILIKVRDFCNSRSINYFLAYGTLLGAIRHKGYIPWDDDIDIMMPRKDYNRFLQEFNGFYKELEVLAPELDLNYYAPYANVIDNRTLLVEPHINHHNIGVKIDIFPMDNVPDNEYQYQEICKESGRLNAIRMAKTSNISFYKGVERLKLLIKKVIYSTMKYSQVQANILELAKKSNSADGSNVDCIVFITIKNRKFSKSCINDFVLVPFEGEYFSAPRNYDSCLTALFGDYMKLPPENKRVPHHNFKVFWK